MYIERFGQTIKNIVHHSPYLFVPVGATFYCCHGSRLPNEYLMLNPTPTNGLRDIERKTASSMSSLHRTKRRMRNFCSACLP